MDLEITWLVFFELIVGLCLLFLVLKGFSKLSMQLFKRHRYKRKFKKWFEIILEFYKPFAILTIVAAFVIINYQIHGVIVLVVGIVLYKHIRNYCNGIFFKINPLVDVGVNLITGNDQGEIEKLMPLGLIMKVERGERFINYTTIEDQGFFVNQKSDGSTRKTLYLIEAESTGTIMDALFENPLIDFSQKPSIWTIPGETNQQLQVSLEKGAKIETIIDYLNQNNIKTSQTKP
jgi:hypothetical protein